MRHKRAGNARQKADSEVIGPLAPVEREDARPQYTVGKASRDRIRQAESDVSRGLKDTDLHGTPTDVPGPAPDPQHSPGAKPSGKG